MSRLGFPDNGNNRFSDVLPYADWVKVAGAETARDKFVSELGISILVLTCI